MAVAVAVGTATVGIVLSRQSWGAASTMAVWYVPSGRLENRFDPETSVSLRSTRLVATGRGSWAGTASCAGLRSLRQQRARTMTANSLPSRCRRPVRAGAALLALALGTLCAPLVASAAAAATPSSEGAAIVAIARDAMKADALHAVIVRVTVNGEPVITKALGTSTTGVPATPAMHFRNGAVAISYMSTLLMEYVDEHKISLGDTVARWLPSLPDANQVTVKMLADMTSGYPDYVTDPAFIAEEQSDPFVRSPGHNSWPLPSPGLFPLRLGRTGGTPTPIT
jgi:hypothetical protein